MEVAVVGGLEEVVSRVEAEERLEVLHNRCDGVSCILLVLAFDVGAPRDLEGYGGLEHLFRLARRGVDRLRGVCGVGGLRWFGVGCASGGSLCCLSWGCVVRVCRCAVRSSVRWRDCGSWVRSAVACLT